MELFVWTKWPAQVQDLGISHAPFILQLTVLADTGPKWRLVNVLLGEVWLQWCSGGSGCVCDCLLAWTCWFRDWYMSSSDVWWWCSIKHWSTILAQQHSSSCNTMIAFKFGTGDIWEWSGVFSWVELHCELQCFISNPLCWLTHSHTEVFLLDSVQIKSNQDVNTHVHLY